MGKIGNRAESPSVLQACRWWSATHWERCKIHQRPRTPVMGHKSCYRWGMGRKSGQTLASMQRLAVLGIDSSRLSLRLDPSCLHQGWGGKSTCAQDLGWYEIVVCQSWGGIDLNLRSPTIQARNRLLFVGGRGRNAETASPLKLRCTRSVNDRGRSRKPFWPRDGTCME